MVESDTTYLRMTPPMSELMRRLKARPPGSEFAHFGNPVALWMADSIEREEPARRPRPHAAGQTGP